MRMFEDDRGDAEADERIELHLVVRRVVAEDESLQREVDEQRDSERREKRRLQASRAMKRRRVAGGGEDEPPRSDLDDEDERAKSTRARAAIRGSGSSRRDRGLGACMRGSVS